MQIRRADCAISFNVWNSRGTWFWSLVYPDRQGGAIGAAASEAEAVGEAKAAIERLPDPDAANTCHTHQDSSFARPFDNFNSSHAFIGCKVDAPARDLKCLPVSRVGQAKILATGDRYGDLWHLTLQRFAEWVAAA
jgi:hypothetical protein